MYCCVRCGAGICGEWAWEDGVEEIGVVWRDGVEEFSVVWKNRNKLSIMHNHGSDMDMDMDMDTQ